MKKGKQPKLVVTIRGNCGVIHHSFKEWSQCRACDPPPGHLRIPRLWNETALIPKSALDALFEQFRA